MADAFLDALASRMSAPTGAETGSDISAPAAQLHDRVGQISNAVQQTATAIKTRTATAPDRGELADAPKVLFSSDGKHAVAGGHLYDLTNYQSLQELTKLDESKLTPMRTDVPGWEPTTLAKVKGMFDAIQSKPEFVQRMAIMDSRMVGGLVSAIQSLAGNDRPSNWWTDKAEQGERGMSMGGQKAQGEGPFGSKAGFIGGLGDMAGGIIPVVAAGSVGALPGSVAMAGGSAHGQFALQYYDSVSQALQQMDDAQRRAASPLYAQMRDKGLSEDEATKEVANAAGNAAGVGPAALSAAEVLIGARLFGGALNKIPVLGKLAERAGLGENARIKLPDGIAAALEKLPGAARFAGRVGSGGALAGVDMMAQSGLAGANAARVTGMGSTNPLDYTDSHQFAQGFQFGSVLAALGGGHAAARADGADPAIAAATATVEGRRAAAEATPAGAFDNVSPQQLNQHAETALSPQDAQARMDILQRTMARLYGADWAQHLDTLARDPHAGPLLAEMAQHANVLRNRMPADAAPGTQGQIGLPEPPQPAQPAHVGAAPAPEDLGGSTGNTTQNPAQADAFPLGNRTFEDVQGDLRDLDAKMTQKFGPRWRASKQAARTKVGKDALAHWEELTGEAETLAHPAQVEGLPRDGATPVPPIREGVPLAGDPAQPPSATMADGRPMGVAPKPLPNPDPMSPEEAASRARTQAARGEAAPAAPVDHSPAGETNALLARLKAAATGGKDAAGASERGVTPSTPEPPADLAAQFKALADPNNPKDSVFIAKGNEDQIPARFKKGTVKGVRVAVRDEGTLYTTSDRKLNTFRNGTLSDTKLAKILGYPVTKAETLRSSEPVVVTGTDKAGAAVVASVSPKEKAKAVAAKLAKQTPADGVVVESTPREAQAARAEQRTVRGTPVVKGEVKAAPKLGPKAEAAKSKAKAKAAPKLGPKAAAARERTTGEKSKPKAKAKADEERKPASLRERVAAEEGPAGDVSRAEHAALESAGHDDAAIEHRLPLTHSELTDAGLRLRELARAKDPRVADVLHAIYRRTITGNDLKEAIRTISEATAKDARDTFTSAPQRFRTMPELIAFARNLDPSKVDALEGSPARHNVFEHPAHEVGERLTTPRVRLLGHDVAPTMAKILNGWIETVEKSNPGVLPAKIELMSLREWSKLHNHPVQKGRMGHVFQRGDVVQIALDHGDMHDAQRVETMAHELGHVISDRILANADEATRAAVERDYKNWLQANGHLSPADLIRSRTLLAIGTTIDAHMTDHEYAASRREWEADQIGRWLVTDEKPRTAVERVWKSIADTVKGLYNALARMLGDEGKPAPSIQQFMDSWVAESRVKSRAMHVAARGALDAMRGADEALPEHEQPKPPAPHLIMRAVPEGARQMGKALLDAIGNRDAAALRNAADRVEGSRLGRTAKRGLLRGAFTLQNMKDYTKSMGEFGEHVGRWVDEVFRRQQTAIRAGEQGRQAIARAMNLSGKTKAILNELMHKATVYGIHPDKPFEDKANAHLRTVDDEVTNANWHRWRELNALYRALGNEGKIRGQDVYKELGTAFRKLYRDTIATQLRQIRADKRLSEEERAEMIHRLQQSKDTVLKGPYFPLMREGDIITTAALPPQRIDASPNHPFFETRADADARAKFIRAMNPHAKVKVETVTDENGQKFHELWVYERAVYFHKSFNEAKDARAQIEADMKGDWKAATGKDWDELSKDPEFADELKVSDPKVKRDYYEELLKVPSGFLQKIDSLNAKGEMDAGTHNALRMMYLESLPQFSYRKSTMPRANIRGADMDMLRAYATRLTGAAHNFAAIKHASELDDAWTQADAIAKGDQHDILSAAFLQQQAYYKRLQNTPMNNTLDMLTDISSSMSLAFSPGYALMNATQPLVTTLPVLAGMVKGDGALVGASTAAKYLREAYGNGATGFFGKRAVTEMLTELKRIAGQKADGETLQESAQHIIDQFAKSDGERKMLKHLLDLGRLDFSFLNTQHDAALSAAGSKARAVVRLGMTLPQQIESVNRLVTALATHRMAVKELGLSDREATRMADDIVSQTQFVYDKVNRPEAFNHPLGSVVLQFKLFVQGMYSLMARNVAMALRGETPEVRKQGMATLGYMLASNVALGGATGLGPIWGGAKLALGLLAMSGLMGEDDKKKRELVGTDAWVAQLAREALGDDNAEVAQHGLPALAGLDVSDRVGIPNLVDTRYMDLREGDDTGSTFDKTVLYAMGAPYANARRLVALAGAAKDLDGKEAAKNLPSGLRSMFTAADWASHGIRETDGDTFIDSSELSPIDILAKGLGLGSAKVNEAYQNRRDEFQTLDRIRTQRSQLLARFRNADGELERAQARAEIHDFNAGVPKAFKVTPEQLHQSLRQHTSPQNKDPQRKAARKLVEG